MNIVPCYQPSFDFPMIYFKSFIELLYKAALEGLYLQWLIDRILSLPGKHMAMSFMASIAMIIYCFMH